MKATMNLDFEYVYSLALEVFVIYLGIYFASSARCVVACCIVLQRAAACCSAKIWRVNISAFILLLGCVLMYFGIRLPLLPGRRIAVCCSVCVAVCCSIVFFLFYVFGHWFTSSARCVEVCCSVLQ